MAFTETDAVELILAELKRAKEQHPIWPTDPIHAAAIINEEAGELIQAANDYTYDRENARSTMIEESVQVGAMAIRFLTNIGKYSADRSRVVDDSQ